MIIGCGSRKSDPDAIVNDVVNISHGDDWTGLVKYLDKETRERFEENIKENKETVKELEKQLGKKLDIDFSTDSITHGLKNWYVNSWTNEGMKLKIDVPKKGQLENKYVACIKSNYTSKEGMKTAYDGVIVLTKEDDTWILDRETQYNELPYNYKEFCKK
jgi:uncharacterized protein YneR